MSTLALRRDNSRLALAALVFGALVIATSPILVRLAACGPAAAGFWRLGFAMPLLALMAVGSPRSGGEGGGIGTPSRAMLLAGLWFALDLGCWHYGIRYTSVANATVLPNLTPVIVTLVSWFAFRERPRRGVPGRHGDGDRRRGADGRDRPGRAAGAAPHIGDILSASTAIWYALYFIAVRSARLTRSTLSVMLWSCLVGAPPLLVTALVLHEQILPATALGWAAAVGLGPGPCVRPGLDRLGARPPAGLDRLGDRAGAAGRRRAAGLLRVRRDADRRCRRWAARWRWAASSSPSRRGRGASLASRCAPPAPAR